MAAASTPGMPSPSGVTPTSISTVHSIQVIIVVIYSVTFGLALRVPGDPFVYGRMHHQALRLDEGKRFFRRTGSPIWYLSCRILTLAVLIILAWMLSLALFVLLLLR